MIQFDFTKMMRSVHTMWKPGSRLFSSATSLVRTEYIGSTGVIYLSDPTRLNALTVSMGAQFMEAVDEMCQASDEQKIRACVVTGDGELPRQFSICSIYLTMMLFERRCCI